MATTIPSSSVEIAALRNAVRGSVLAPGDEGWDEARTPWNVAFDQQPALIERLPQQAPLPLIEHRSRHDPGNLRPEPLKQITEHQTGHHPHAPSAILPRIGQPQGHLITAPTR